MASSRREFEVYGCIRSMNDCAFGTIRTRVWFCGNSMVVLIVKVKENSNVVDLVNAVCFVPDVVKVLSEYLFSVLLTHNSFSFCTLKSDGVPCKIRMTGLVELSNAETLDGSDARLAVHEGSLILFGGSFPVPCRTGLHQMILPYVISRLLWNHLCPCTLHWLPANGQ